MNKKITKLALLGLAVVGVSGVAGTIASTDTFNTYASTNDTYSCVDIVFGETYDSTITAKTDLKTEDQIKEVVSNHTGLTGKDFTLTNWVVTSTCTAGYKERKETASGSGIYNYYPIKLSSGSYPGDVILTLKNGKTCDKAIVYAVGWANKIGVKLGVGGSNVTASTSIAETPKGATKWDFSNSYTFTFNSTSEIHFKALTDKMVLISKIILRVKTSSGN